MTIDEKNIIWLDLFENLSLQKKFQLLNTISKGKDLRKDFLKNDKIREILSNEEFNKMALCLEDKFLDLKLNEYESQGIKCITYFSENYPYLLKEIKAPPICLYCKGNLSLLDSFCLGIVGTRRPTDYGVVVTKQYAKTFAKNDITIVSGLASGVDTIAHKTALEEGGNTIAVLAGGLNHVYPAVNHQLAKQITENNLILSENNPNVVPQAFMFPIRNRIIAGLSCGVLITEAGEKSGALHTYNYAIENNRDVFVVPGRINSPMSKGTNMMIKEMQGVITLDPDDVLDNFHINKKNNEENLEIQLDISTQDVLSFIKTEKKTFQELIDLTGKTASELNSLLLELEMNGIVTKLPNNSYIMS